MALWFRCSPKPRQDSQGSVNATPVVTDRKNNTRKETVKGQPWGFAMREPRPPKTKRVAGTTASLCYFPSPNPPHC